MRGPALKLLLPLCAWLCACASAAPHTDVSPAEVSFTQESSGGAAAAAVPVIERDDGAPSVLTRAAVRRAVDLGIGAFLSGVELTPVVSGGRFAGFRVDAARDLRRWNAAGLSLRAGDVVTRVNGSPVERPEQAQAVFLRMLDANEVVVDVVRGSAPVTLRVPVLPGEAVMVAADAGATAPVTAPR